MLYETDAGDLIDFAKRWVQLGWAVSEQVEQVVDNPETDEVNPAAIELARSRLRGLNEELDQTLGHYLARYREAGS